MPVYEYQCSDCEKVFEVQQKITDSPLTECPACKGPVRKLVSMTSFQLKGGGWYSDGYSSVSSTPSSSSSSTAATPPCQTGAGCSSCPAAAGK